MAQFVVLEPVGETIAAQAGTGSRARIAPHYASAQQAEASVFVRDGFSILALILPVIWLLGNRLWFEAFAVLGATVLLGIAGTMLEIVDAIPLFSLLLSLFVALDGPNWKIAKLKRQGYQERATIDAHNLDEAEIRYFSLYQTQEKDEPEPDWFADVRKAHMTPNAMKNPTASTIGFVGYRGEN